MLVLRHAFGYVAFWQLLSFMILLLLVWVNALLDLSALFWGATPRQPDLSRTCLASAGVIFAAFVTIGHTYLQQRRIVTGILTICSYCHKIRIEKEVWQRIEEFVSRSSSIMLSHGICPDCYPNVIQSMEKNAAERPQGVAS